MAAITAAQSFVHGGYRLDAGDTLDDMPDALAGELADAGLVTLGISGEQKQAAVASNKKAADPANKAAPTAANKAR